MVRLAAYGGLSTAAAAYVVLSAFRQRSNFFAAAVYLSKSNASMMLLWNFGIFLTILFGRGVQTVFFGPLRLIEVERMHERVWYAITESLLALTIFREAFDTSFVILFVSLLFLKIFHWLASDRVEMMEQAPTIPRLFHVRMVCLLSILWTIDAVLIAVAADSILTEGPSVMIMFASEYMILLATLVGTTLKYGANAYDLRNEVPWENKSVFIFYVELACDFLKLATYLCFFSLILTFYGLPLNILRDVYITARSFINKVRDLSRYRQATRNMDTRYPNASTEEMERLSDKTCIICREDMEARTDAQNQARDSRQGPNDTPKKLPCGHIFHFHCLRSWLERQQSCPTCRRPVLLSNSSTGHQPVIAPPPAPAQNVVAPPNRPDPQAGEPTSTAGTVATRPNHPQTNDHLSVPSGPHARPSAPSPIGSRRRAGPENPLVAFQLRSASKPPANPPSQTTVQGNGEEKGEVPSQLSQTPSHTAPSRALAGSTVESSKTASREGNASQKSSHATLGSFGGPTDIDAQRRQRLEAVLRRRGTDMSDSVPSSAIEPASNTASQTFPVPTPTIKIDGAAGPSEDASVPSDSASQAPDPVPRTPAIPETLPTVLSRIRDDPITPLDSRASSPVTILAPTGAFGGRSHPPPQPSTIAANLGVFPTQIPAEADAASWTMHTASGHLSRISAADMPRLIPLFDPSDPNKPSSLVRFLPSLLRSGIWSTETTSQSSSQADMVHLPAELDEGQLASLAEITREGLETRLELLNDTQGALQACIGQLQKAMKIIDTRDVQGILQTVTDLNANASEQGGAALTDADGKGKGKESQRDQPPEIVHGQE